MIRRLIRKLEALRFEKQVCPDSLGYPKGPFTDNQVWVENQWGWGWLRRLKYRIVNDWGYGPWQHKFREAWRQHPLFKHIYGWSAIMPDVPYAGGDVWEFPWQPRTCSFCGSVHPDDAVKLIKQGWRIEPTTKGYKYYLETPATRHNVWHAVPPVKLYMSHFDAGAIARVNAAVDFYRSNGAAE